MKNMFLLCGVLALFSFACKKEGAAPDNPGGTEVSTGYRFDTTNFNDGWTSTIESDWVKVQKGSLTVLIHFPKAGTISSADPDPLTRTAWDMLVAPRYSNLKNFKTVSPTEYQRSYFGGGDVTDQSGQSRYVALYRTKRRDGWSLSRRTKPLL